MIQNSLRGYLTERRRCQVASWPGPGHHQTLRKADTGPLPRNPLPRLVTQSLLQVRQDIISSRRQPPGVAALESVDGRRHRRDATR